MAQSDAMHSCGTNFFWSLASGSPSYSRIARIIDINDAGDAVAVTDVSNLDFCADQKIPGRINGQDVTLTMNFTDAQYATLKSLLRSYLLFRIVFPSLSIKDFEGFISNLGETIPDNDRITCEVTFTVSDVSVFTPGG